LSAKYFVLSFDRQISKIELREVRQNHLVDVAKFKPLNESASVVGQTLFLARQAVSQER